MSPHNCHSYREGENVSVAVGRGRVERGGGRGGVRGGREKGMRKLRSRSEGGGQHFHEATCSCVPRVVGGFK